MEENLKIINTFCGDIEDRIKACRSKEIAELLADRLCIEVDLGCHSSIVQNVLKSHINQLIGQVFDRQGNNRFLEEQDEKQTNSH